MNLSYFNSMTLESLYDLYNQMSNDYPFDNTSIKAVPPDIVRGMIDLIPDEFWANKDVKIIEFPLIDGSFLFYCCQKLMEGLRKEIPNRAERLKHITCNCLYGSTLRVKGSQIRLFKARTYLDIPNEHLYTMTEGGSKLYNSNNHREGVEGMPKFDLVVGNPPYNNDIYIDFVLQAQKLSKDKVVMITPAKWQAKAGDKNEEFRQNIVPYMDKVVYYPDTKEVFDIGVPSLTYFLLNKFKLREHRVKNIKKGVIVADEITDDLTILNLKAKSILTKLISDNPMQIETSMFGRLGLDRELEFTDFTGIPTCDTDVLFKKGKRIYGYLPIEYIRKNADIALNEYKVMMSMKFMPDNVGLTLYIYNKKEIAPKEYICVYHGSLGACKSVVSYMQSKLVFFVFKTCIQGTAKDVGLWRFIPDLKDWTVVYEDRPLPNYTPDSNGFYIDSEGKRHCSLYVKYGLSEDEIALVESVIKSRRD